MKPTRPSDAASIRINSHEDADTAYQIKQIAATIAAGIVSTITDDDSYRRISGVANREGKTLTNWITISSVKQAISINNTVNEIIYADDVTVIGKGE